jgi:hypothetical protein
MHHYALMTDATAEDLNKLEYSMKSFFSKKMQGTLSLEQVASEAKTTEGSKDSVVTYTEKDSTVPIATETTKEDGTVVIAYYTPDGKTVFKTDTWNADDSQLTARETKKWESVKTTLDTTAKKYT